MSSTLRRSRRRELVLTRSFTRAIQDKVRPESSHTGGKECRAFFADRTNAHLHTPFASTFEASTRPVLTSRPSMMLSLYHSANPHLPVHPIHRLPPELLVHVFVLGSVDNVMFPVLVSHVCHSWRTIALHAHSIWRRVSLSPDSNVHMWKERIRRARLCNLDVVVASSPCSRAFYDIDVVALQMHILAPYISELRSLDIQFSSYAPYLWNAALGPLCHSPSHLWGNRSFNGVVEAPKLESLNLRYAQNDDIKEFGLFGGFTPKLARVTLEGVRLTWLPELFGNLSFLDYTHHGFTRGEEAVDEILFMLQISSQIRELKLCICHKTTLFQVLHLRRPPVSDDNIILPCLESLSLRVNNEDSDIPSELNAILSRISAPNLKKLYLQDLCAAASGSLNQHLRPFAALPASIDAMCRNTSLSNRMAEGRWIEPSLLFRPEIRFSSLTSIHVGNIVTPIGVSEM